MNASRRKELSVAATKINEAASIIYKALSAEQSAFDKLSDNAQMGDKGMEIEDIISNLQSAYDNLNDASDYLGYALE